MAIDPRNSSSYAAISGVSDSGMQSIQASQSAHPEWYPSGGLLDSFTNFTDRVESGLNDAANMSVEAFYSPTSALGASRSKLKPKTIDYLNADLAKHYGLSRGTAYQEAMANTAYQRSVADMKAAGLNPAVLFGSGKGSPADGAAYVREPGTGRSNSARSYGSKSKSDSKLFSGSTYSAMSMIGGLIGMMVTGKPDGFWIGSQTAQGAMGLADSVSRK